MGIDNIIKKSIEDSVDNLDLTVEKYEEMFDYITNQERTIKRSFIKSLLKRVNILFRRINFKEAVGVAAFVMVLILVPTAVKYSRSKDINAVVDKDIRTEKNVKGYDFSRQLELLVSDIIPRNREIIKDEKEIKEKVPFPIEYPKFIPEGYKLANTDMEINEDYIGKIYSVALEYKTASNNTFMIMQITETGKPGDIDKCEKISINGVDAYLYDPKIKNGNMQLMLWKNGKYYNVISESAGRDNIINIAKSLDFNLQGDTRKSYRNGTFEYFEYNDSTKKMVPFAVDYPKYTPNGFKINNTQILQLKKEDKLLTITRENYNNGTGSMIAVSETDDKSKFQNITGKFKKETIDGIDGWYREDVEDKNKITQIIFWKNEKLYSVKGSNVTKEELIKVAKSL